MACTHFRFPFQRMCSRLTEIGLDDQIHRNNDRYIVI